MVRIRTGAAMLAVATMLAAIGTAAAGASVSARMAAPTVRNAYPAAGQRSVSQLTNVVVAFDMAVIGVDRTTLTLTSDDGLGVPATVTYNPATRVAVLDPLVTLAKDRRWTVRVAPPIGSASGGVPIVARSWSFLTGPAPQVTRTFPRHLSVGVNRTWSQAVTFSEHVRADSFRIVLRKMGTTTDIAATVAPDWGASRYILDPTPTLEPNTWYTVYVKGGAPWFVTDLAGNPLAATSTFSFRTGA